MFMFKWFMTKGSQWQMAKSVLRLCGPGTLGALYIFNRIKCAQNKYSTQLPSFLACTLSISRFYRCQISRRFWLHFHCLALQHSCQMGTDQMLCNSVLSGFTLTVLYISMLHNIFVRIPSPFFYEKMSVNRKFPWIWSAIDILNASTLCVRNTRAKQHTHRERER